MKKNENKGHINMRLETLQHCDWYSRLNQERYWVGSPWRAISEMLR